MLADWPILRQVLIPVLLLLCAVLTAAVMAYGTHPAWAQFPGGLEFILLARRAQWPLAAVALIFCLALLALVIAGRRRAWWLMGLGPVLALFVHRFASDPANQYQCIENPPFVLASDARHVEDEDWVVTLQFADGHYAYPFAALFDAPVVIHAEHDKRVAVLWSAFANRAMAVPVGREFRAADLEVVGTPANMLIVYNGRLGQFINGVTGRTTGGQKPDGVGDPLAAVAKTTWETWRKLHPDGKVLMPVGPNYAVAPRVPIRPAYPLPSAYRSPGDKFLLVGATQPLAIPASKVTADPLNVTADGMAALVFRDPAGGAVRAFERRVEDVPPLFRRNPKPRLRPKALLVDDYANAGWNADGAAVDGPAEIRGKRLGRLPIDGDLHLGILTFAYRGLSMYEEENAAPASVAPPAE